MSSQRSDLVGPVADAAQLHCRRRQVTHQPVAVDGALAELAQVVVEAAGLLRDGLGRLDEGLQVGAPVLPRSPAGVAGATLSRRARATSSALLSPAGRSSPAPLRRREAPPVGVPDRGGVSSSASSAGSGKPARSRTMLCSTRSPSGTSTSSARSWNSRRSLDSITAAILGLGASAPK